MYKIVFKPMVGAAGFQHSNPSVLCTSALLGSLSVFEQTTMADLRAKSKLLTGYLEHLLRTEITTTRTASTAGSTPAGSQPERVLDIITPQDPEQRGAQLSLVFRGEGKMMEIFDRLMQNAIIGDERKPDVIRVAPAPLYCRFEDVRFFVIELKKLVAEVYA